jgi:hypothetical protein
MTYAAWTPAVVGLTQVGATITTNGTATYNHQSGSIVTQPDGTFIATFAISFDAASFAASSPTGGLSIAGLPITQSGLDVWDSGKFYLIKWDGLPFTQVGGEMPSGRTGTMDLVGMANGSHRAVLVSDLPATGTIVLSGTLVGHS